MNFFGRKLAFAKLFIGTTLTMGSLPAYSQVCGTKTINGSTSSGATC